MVYIQKISFKILKINENSYAFESIAIYFISISQKSKIVIKCYQIEFVILQGRITYEGISDC